jgi:hypothetical protein
VSIRKSADDAYVSQIDHLTFHVVNPKTVKIANSTANAPAITLSAMLPASRRMALLGQAAFVPPLQRALRAVLGVARFGPDQDAKGSAGGKNQQRC